MDPEVIAIFVSIGVPALVGLIGYYARSIRASRVADREKRTELLARLRRLSSLINSSLRVFLAQNKQRERLLKMLVARDSDEARKYVGYEAKFAGMFNTFTAEEKQLHGIIRAMTEVTVKPLNESVSEWLAQDTTFKYGLFSVSDPVQLSVYLSQLELHLLLWHAKFKYWMEDEKHALVYLADEAKHGLGFPDGIEKVVDAALAELGEPADREAQSVLDG